MSLVDSLYFYKVLIPEANGTGTIGEILSTPIIGTPMLAHTDTFLSIGKFDNVQEAKNCLKYIRTKFARTMLGTLKATQHNPRDTWNNVPLQDFTEHSDINWNCTISEIDHQLYAKYGLSEKEISFIEKMIKPMWTLSKILCKWKQDSVISSFLYLDSVLKDNHKLVHNQAPV